MRIAVVVSSFPLISETFILNQITGLIDLGHSVDILALHKPPTNIHIQEAVLKYSLLSKTKYFEIPRRQINRIIRGLKTALINFFISPKTIIKCLTDKNYSRYQKINNLFKLEPFMQKKYDIIHCHFGPIGQEFCFIKNYFPKVKFFISFHGHDIQLGLNKEKSFYEELFKKSDYIICPTQFCRTTLESLGCPTNKCIIHPNGVNTDKFNPSIKTHQRKHTHITTVARLHEDKNLFCALEIISNLISKHKIQITYNIVGDGNEHNLIKQEINKRQLNSVVMLWGALAQEDVIKILAETDIFLLTSRQEGFGIVLLEAQAIGIPVIASPVGGIPEAVTSKSAFLFSLSNPSEATNHILNLINNTQLCEQMGQAGINFVHNNFNNKHLNHRLSKIFLELKRNEN